MKFAIITPDRGDRSQFTSFCLHQIERQQLPLGSFTHIHVNYPPKSSEVDLIERVRHGIDQAKMLGYDWVIMMENDDFYPKDYLSRFIPFMDNADFIGDEQTIYYNLRNRTYSIFDHPHRSSLFTTAFRISALNNFEWPTQGPNLDIMLWKYARHKRRKFIKTGAVGIKHGIGKCGGIGHTRMLRYHDKDMVFLKERVDGEALAFYKSLTFKERMEKV
jgi:hypothetical protein